MNLTHSPIEDSMYDAELYAESTRGEGKQWVAIVTGTHPKYGLDRDFVAYAGPHEHGKGNERIRVGDLVEHRKHADSHAPQNEYFVSRTSELQRITEDLFYDIADQGRDERFARVDDLTSTHDIDRKPQDTIEGIEIYGVETASDANHYDEHLVIGRQGDVRFVPVSGIDHPEYDEEWDADRVYVWYNTIAEKVIDDDTAYAVIVGDGDPTYRNQMKPEKNPQLVLRDRGED